MLKIEDILYTTNFRQFYKMPSANEIARLSQVIIIHRQHERRNGYVRKPIHAWGNFKQLVLSL